MRVYETTFILSPQADDAAFDRQIKAVSDLISRYKGKVLEEDRWGVRRLAYAIKKFTQGYYTRIVFEGNNTILKELDRFYRLEEPYIRNLTVAFEGKLKEKENEETESFAPRKAVTEKRKPEETTAAPKVEEKPMEVKTEPVKEETSPAEAPVPEPTTPAETESADDTNEKPKEEL